MDKTLELSLDRTFSILGRGNLSVSPEKIIIYGIFFIGIVIFVNWFLSFTIIVIKPFLYAALMLAVLRPEFIQSLTTEESVQRLLEAAKIFITSFALNVMDFLNVFSGQFGQPSNSSGKPVVRSSHSERNGKCCSNTKQSCAKTRQ